MASTLEQCDNKPLGPLSSTLEMFDTFKTSQDDDKDSDEESFHLPLLGCDDDLDTGKETEDDILNKFECTTPSDLKVDESILNEEDGSVNKTDGLNAKVDANVDLNAKVDANVDLNAKVDTNVDPAEKNDECLNESFDEQEAFKDLEIVDETDEDHSGDDTKNHSSLLNETGNDQESSETNTQSELKENKDDQVLPNEQVSNEEKEHNENTQLDDVNESNELLENFVNENNETVLDAENNENEGSDEIKQSDEILQSTESIRDEDKKLGSEAVSEEVDEQMEVDANEKMAGDLPKENLKDLKDVDKGTDQDIKEHEETDAADKITDGVVDEAPEEQETVVEGGNDSEDVSDAVNQENEKASSNNGDEESNSNNDVSEAVGNENETVNEASDTVNEESDILPEENESVNKDSALDELIDAVNTVSDAVDHESDINKETDTLVTEEGDALSELNDGANEINDLKNSDKEISSIIDLDSAEELMDTEDVEISPKDSVAENTEVPASTEKSENDLEINNKELNSTLVKTHEDTIDLQKDIPSEEDQMDIDDLENKETNEDAQLDDPLAIDDSSSKSNEKDKPVGKPQTQTESKDLDCDDLLNISLIRDVDEDNASAIAEIADSHSNEKSDNDEQDEDKPENEIDDTDEQDDSVIDRDEPMEYEDTNSCDQDTSTTDNVISENTSDGENKENEPLSLSESESQNPPTDVTTETSSNDPADPLDTTLQKPAEAKDIVEEQSSKPAEESGEAPSAEAPAKPTDEPAEKQEKPKEKSSPVTKRPLSEKDKKEGTVPAKKVRLSQGKTVEKKKPISKVEKIKTLINFEQFMKKRNLGENKLSRSDLEQFCLQKICEAMIHKTEVGELHQTIKKLEQVIDNLRKDLQQLGKQTRDLDIVNKKLMNELRAQTGSHKPLVPLKITRSVGLQVKLNLGLDAPPRRKTFTTNNTPKTPTTPNNNAAVNRARNVAATNNVVRQLGPGTPTAKPAVNSPRKPATPAPILSQALQTRPTSTPSSTTSSTMTTTTTTTPQVAKRVTSIRPKTADTAKPSAPGVIDLTDEDDRTVKKVTNVPQKMIGNKPAATSMKILSKNINVVQNKGGAKANNMQPKNLPMGQVKSAGMGQVKTSGVGTKVGMQARAVASLPQGVRLTTTQMKNGITLPAGVVTSSAGGTTQLMYVVQPGSLVNTTAGGGQKAVLLNFQPSNGVLTSTINGSTVSVIPSKSANSMQLKTLTTPSRKHPAPLPLPPPSIINSSLKKLLPKPHLSIRKTDTGIILQWRMPYNLDDYEGIASYQLFAYQETNAPPSTDMWRKVGDVKALALPMACTLTQFADKNKYYFAVRSVDVHKRIGAFSDPEEISL